MDLVGKISAQLFKTDQIGSLCFTGGSSVFASIPTGQPTYSTFFLFYFSKIIFGIVFNYLKTLKILFIITIFLKKWFCNFTIFFFWYFFFNFLLGCWINTCNLSTHLKWIVLTHCDLLFKRTNQACFFFFFRLSWCKPTCMDIVGWFY